MSERTHIQIAHGGGGRLTEQLIREVILPALGPGASAQDPLALKDAAVLDASSRVAFTTDGYVVQPLEFPGGDIGKLAICGTVNDLAVVGAKAAAISLALVLEEGLEISLLARVLRSAGEAASAAGVRVVTGDTKVVERGACSGMTVTASGLGWMIDGADLGFGRVERGDRLVLSGPLGEHGLAVLAARKGLSFSSDLISDCAPLNEPAEALVRGLGADLKFMRDPTRGGLAATTVELACAAGRDLEIEDQAIPVNRTALAAAEMLGLDLLSIANEGKLLAVVAAGAAAKAVEILRGLAVSRKAAVIGAVGAGSAQPMVELVTEIGGRRIVPMPYGEDLPRIC